MHREGRVKDVCYPDSFRHIFMYAINFSNLIFASYLTYLIPLFSYYTPWKHQKTRSFLMFLGDTEKNQWHEIG